MIKYQIGLFIVAAFTLVFYPPQTTTAGEDKPNPTIENLERKKDTLEFRGMLQRVENGNRREELQILTLQLLIKNHKKKK